MKPNAMLVKADAYLNAYGRVEELARKYEQEARDAEFEDREEDFMRYRHTADILHDLRINAF